MSNKENLDSTEVNIDKVVMVEAITEVATMRKRAEVAIKLGKVEVAIMTRRVEEDTNPREAVATSRKVLTTKSKKVASLSTMTDHTEVITTTSMKEAREVETEDMRNKSKRNLRSRKCLMMDSSLSRADMRRTRNPCHLASQRDPELPKVH
jgi:hypothetical protein